MMSAITKSLLIRYFKGYCNKEEKIAVQAFIAAGTDPALVEASMEEAFETQSPDQLLLLSEDEYSHAWQQFRHRSGWQQQPKMKRTYLSGWRRYAAAAVLVLTIGIAGYQTILHVAENKHHTLAEAMPQRIEAVRGTAKRITLNDGSTVYLFPGSTLLVPEAFNKKDRAVELKGRAFFEVTQHPGKPFLVQAGTLSARVLGTSFEVNGYDDQQVAVTVRTGRVGVADDKKELALLNPDQQIIYHTNSGACTVNAADAAGLCSWVSGELVFDRTPLTEVCRTLEQWYGISIALDNVRWRDKKITVKFRQQPLSTVLQILSLASGFKYEQAHDHVKII
ncbi:FecR family protein [Chitinophaga sp. 22321]|uniref:FecR domain-containing protein n=1 Tax=Chitinophaga hostae TaxID=2831022 RepID=A0ABS5J2K0_9BACT|nr:FecR family protein [Chitinophaga hostae]MBS0029305.1 FecR domain-containing protein [Chitinophaga hostae]